MEPEIYLALMAAGTQVTEISSDGGKVAEVRDG